MRRSIPICLAALTFGCASDQLPTGLLDAVPTGGPRLRFEPNGGQMPPIAPFPSDVFTRPDSTSATGLRVNLAAEGPGDPRLRAWINAQEGFALYAPIAVPFDAPIDTVDLQARHNNTSRLDDAIFVINVDPDSIGYGESVPLDLGRAPALPPSFWPSNAGATGAHSGAIPAVRARLPFLDDWSIGGSIWLAKDEQSGDAVAAADGAVPFFDAVTNTLFIRPQRPLREATTYAVVLSRFVKDREGRAIESPFEFINAASQDDALGPLETILPAAGLNLTDVAFAWTFTTGRPTGAVGAIRRGLEGRGPWAELASLPQPEVLRRFVWTGRTALSGRPLEQLAEALEINPGSMAHLPFVDKLIGGTLASVNLLDSDGYLAPEQARPDELPFWCALPAPGPRRPNVVLYVHGAGGSRVDLLTIAGHHARAGLATCAVDLKGHGFDSDRSAVIEGWRGTTIGRAQDLDGDGTLDSGADLFGGDVELTRGLLIQSAFDVVQMARWLRGLTDAAADLDADGEADLGGPATDVYAWGQDVGGAVATMAGALDPGIVAVGAIDTPGGWLDAAGLGTEGALAAGLASTVAGPVIRVDAGRAEWVFMGPSGLQRSPIGEVELAAGEVLRVRNLRTDEISTAVARDAEPLWISVGAHALSGERRVGLGFDQGRLDASTWAQLGDSFALEIAPSADAAPSQIVDIVAEDVSFFGATLPVGAPIIAPAAGLGLQPQTSAARTQFPMRAWQLEAVDPIVWAPRLFERPLDMSDMYPERRAETGAFLVTTPGDQRVPTAASLAFARAAGLLDDRDRRADLAGMTVDGFLLGVGAVEGSLEYARWWDGLGPYHFDVEGSASAAARIPLEGGARLRPVRKTPEGRRAFIRFPYAGRGGGHGVDPSSANGLRTLNQLGVFFTTGAEPEIADRIDAPCLSRGPTDSARCAGD